MKAKASEATRIESRVKQGLCIVVEKDDAGNSVACDFKIHARGVCERHYRFVREKLISLRTKNQSPRTLNPRQRKFLDKAIEQGLLLPEYGVRSFARNDPYEDL